MSIVCRTCLHQIYDDNFLSINDSTVVKNQLSQCIPEMTLSLVTNSIMCTACSAALDFAYNFKSRCLQAEKHILNHMNETASSSNIDGTRLIEILFKPLTNGIKRELIVPDEPQVDYFMSTEEVAVDDDENATDDCTNDEHSLEGGIEIMKQDLEDPDYKPCDAFPVVDNPFSSLTSIEEEADVSSGETIENMDYPNFEEYNLNDSSIVNRKPWKNGLKATYREHKAPERFGNTASSVIDDIIQHSVPLNTKKSQVCIWNQFLKFCKEKNYTLDRNTSVERISHILKDWGYNMKKSDGSDYKESVVKTMWNVTAKLIQEMYCKKYKVIFNPFSDILFKTARDARNAKRKQLRSYPEKRRASSVALTPEEYNRIIRMWDENTPFGLQRKFYHIAAFELAWRRVEAANCMVYYFSQEVDSNGAATGRIEYNPAFTRTSPGGVPSLAGSKWLTPNVTDPDVCAVRLLRKLLAKRNENIKTDRLFLTINPFWNGEKSIGWFKNSPVGINEISKWMKTAARKVGLDTTNTKITNPSSRTAVSQLLNPEFFKITLLNYNFS